MRPVHPVRGFTLIELLAVVVLIGICAALAVPRLNGAILRMRGRAALDQVSADFYYARNLAVREGGRTVIRFRRRADRPECHAPSYTIVVRSTGRTAKETTLDLGPGACLLLGTVDSMTFNSRGFQDGVGRKVYVRQGAVTDSLFYSLLGRTFRWY